MKHAVRVHNCNCTEDYNNCSHCHNECYAEFCAFTIIYYNIVKSVQCKVNGMLVCAECNI